MGNMSVGGLLFISWRFELVAAATEYKRSDTSWLLTGNQAAPDKILGNLLLYSDSVVMECLCLGIFHRVTGKYLLSPILLYSKL